MKQVHQNLKERLEMYTMARRILYNMDIEIVSLRNQLMECTLNATFCHLTGDRKGYQEHTGRHKELQTLVEKREDQRNQYRQAEVRAYRNWNKALDICTGKR